MCVMKRRNPSLNASASDWVDPHRFGALWHKTNTTTREHVSLSLSLRSMPTLSWHFLLAVGTRPPNTQLNVMVRVCSFKV